LAASSVGIPVPGAQVRIVDNERQTVPVGEQGEIVVRTNQMMQGYFNDPALTAQVVDPHGWYYTGDVGYFEDDGYLRLVGRKKDLILCAGETISPKEIERFLETHPSIRRAAVVGVSHSISGESIWAYIEAYTGTQLIEGDIFDFCRGQIAAFKIPQQIRFIDQLPTTATGKLQKYKLRELAEQENL
jgi:fatty-acyl-CoA synthase